MENSDEIPNTRNGIEFKSTDQKKEKLRKQSTISYEQYMKQCDTKVSKASIMDGNNFFRIQFIQTI